MPYRHSRKQSDGSVLSPGIGIPVSIQDRRAGVPGILIKITIACTQACARKIEGSFHLKAFLVGGYVVGNTPVFELNNATDHVPELIPESPYLKGKQSPL